MSEVDLGPSTERRLGALFALVAACSVGVTLVGHPARDALAGLDVWAVALAVGGLALCRLGGRRRWAGSLILGGAILITAAHFLAWRHFPTLIFWALGVLTWLLAAVILFARRSRSCCLLAFATGLCLACLTSAEAWLVVAPLLGSAEVEQLTGQLGQADPQMSSVPRANATVYHRKIDFDVTYRTGPGRDRVVPGRPPVGERWALFGGSFAFGWGLDDAESIAGRLQAANPEARVFNHAMRGHGTADVYIRLQRELADNPDTRLCVYLLIADHLRRTACPDSLTAQSWGLRKPRFTLNNGRPLFLGHAAGTLSLPSQVNVSLLRRSRLYARLYPKWQPSSEALELTASLIRAMNKACESTPGCRFLLVHLPLERAYFDTCVGWDRGALQEWLSALAADGVTVLDCAAKLSAHLAETGDPEQDFYFADRHPNARYADLVAGWVDEFLSEGRVLPADPDDRG